MKSFEAYDTILTRHCWTMVLIVLVAIAAIIAIYFWIRKTIDNKKELTEYAIILGVLLLCVLVFEIYTICTTVHDVQNDAYVVYEGTYETGKHAKVYITDANGKRKTLSDYLYPSPKVQEEEELCIAKKQKSLWIINPI